MKMVVLQFVFVMAVASQYGLVDVWVITPGIMKYPCKLPVTPLFTMPWGAMLFWQAPGLGLIRGGESNAGVTKLPSLNCSTTKNVPFVFLLTLKCRSTVSFPQSFPHAPHSVYLLIAHGPYY